MTVRGYMKRVKENDGRAARNATLKVVLWFVAAQVACVVLYLLFRVEEGPPKAHSITLRGKRNSHSVQASIQAVLEARYFLISLDIGRNSLSSSSHGDSYHGVTGTFCPLDWHLQKQNPSSVAMFRDLIAASHHCQEHSVKLPLEKIVAQARHYDEHGGPTAPHSLEISGVVFHETRCGSTLTANLLSAADSPAHRVYSESSPLLSAILACEGIQDCSFEKRADLIRDTLYLMGRSSDPLEKRVFYKIQSIGVRDINILTNVIPNVPWIFLYRNSIEVIMSHFKDARIANKAVCLRGRKSPHPLVVEIAERQGRTVKSLTNAEYCAVHLASLCESAIRQYESSGQGKFVNYADLPDALYDSILPDYFELPPHSIHTKEMLKAAEVYSKGRGNNANREWQEDSTRKQDKVSTEIKEAASIFLEPSFDKLEELAHAVSIR